MRAATAAASAPAAAMEPAARPEPLAAGGEGGDAGGGAAAVVRAISAGGGGDSEGDGVGVGMGAGAGVGAAMGGGEDAGGCSVALPAGGPLRPVTAGGVQRGAAVRCRAPSEAKPGCEMAAWAGVAPLVHTQQGSPSSSPLLSPSPSLSAAHSAGVHMKLAAANAVPKAFNVPPPRQLL